MASSSYKALHKEATTILTGDFNVVFTEVTPTKSSTDKSMFKYKAKVEDGPHQGHVFYGQITVSPESTGAMRMFFGQMAALGADEAFFNSLPDDISQEQADGLIAQKIEGARAQITVENRPYLGVDRESVKTIKAPGPMTGGVASPMAGMTGSGATVAAPTVSPSLPPSPAQPSGPAAPTTAAPATPY